MRTLRGAATLGRSPVAARPVRRAADAAIHPATRNAAEWRSRAVAAEEAGLAEAYRRCSRPKPLLRAAVKLDEWTAVLVVAARVTVTEVERPHPVLVVAPMWNTWIEQVQATRLLA